jgi:hypothetical protein
MKTHIVPNISGPSFSSPCLLDQAFWEGDTLQPWGQALYCHL